MFLSPRKDKLVVVRVANKALINLHVNKFDLLDDLLSFRSAHSQLMHKVLLWQLSLDRD